MQFRKRRLTTILYVLPAATDMKCAIVIVTSVFLVIVEPTDPGQSCRSAEYKTITGKCCPRCDKGSVVLHECHDEISTSCTPCERGTYMDMDNGLNRCYSCRPCKAEQGFVTERDCTTERDSACTVLEGYYCQATDEETGCSLAQKHLQCAPGQMTKHPGTRTNDTACEDCKTGFYSPDGINCTDWTICLNGTVVLHKGSQTEDTVCNEVPSRHHFLLIPPVLLTGAVVAWLVKGTRGG